MLPASWERKQAREALRGVGATSRRGASAWRWSSSAPSSSFSSSVSQSPRASARPACPPATSPWSKTSPTKSADQQGRFRPGDRPAGREGKLKKTPEPGSDKYDELKEAALGEILERIWIFGQAEELGVSVTDKQVEDELATIKKSNFGTEKAYQKFLKESKFTEEDVNERIRLQLLSTKIQEAVNAEAPPPSEAEVENYYNAAKESQFTENESRDVRVVINKDKSKVEAAKSALEDDDSPANWKTVAKQYSKDPTSKKKAGSRKGSARNSSKAR